MRELFFVLYDGAAWRSAPFHTATGQTLNEAVSLNALAYNIRQEDSDPHFATEAEQYDLYSWHLQALSPGARVAQVPRPGVVLAVHRDTPERIGSAGQSTTAVAVLMRRELESGDDAIANRFSAYLDTPAPRRPAVPLAARDLLVSFDREQGVVVADLVKHLESAQLTYSAIERPRSINSVEGKVWREALASSALLISVVGESSVDSVAVLREAGAAWALGRAVVPALVGVAPNRLHYLLSSYQVREIEAPEDRAALAAEMAGFMGGLEVI